MSIFVGEWIGTLLLVLLGNGTVANLLLSKSKGLNGGWIVATAGWGFAVSIAVYASGWMSGGHLNPAVTVGLTWAGKSPVSAIPLYFLGQMAGAITGAVLVWLTYYSHFEATKNKRHTLLCFSTSPAIRHNIWNFVTEMIATAVLLIGILAIFDVHNGISKGFGPYAVGILIFSIGLSLGGPTGYAINPARDLGPRIVHFFLPLSGKGSSEWDYAWIPVCAPLLGGLLGALIYQWYTNLA